MRRLKPRLPSGRATSYRGVSRSSGVVMGHSLRSTAATCPLQRRQSACLPRLRAREASERPAAVPLKEISANEPTGSIRDAEDQLLCDRSRVLTQYSAKTWRRGSESVCKRLLKRHLCKTLRGNQACHPLPFHPSPVTLWCPFWCPFPGTNFPARSAVQHPLLRPGPTHHRQLAPTGHAPPQARCPPRPLRPPRNRRLAPPRMPDRAVREVDVTTRPPHYGG